MARSTEGGILGGIHPCRHRTIGISRHIHGYCRIGSRHQGTGYEEVGGRAVAGHRNIIENGDAQQGLHIDIVGMGRHGIPEEDHDIDLSLGDHGAELLVSSERSRLEPDHIQLLGTPPSLASNGLPDESARSPGAHQMMTR